MTMRVPSVRFLTVGVALAAVLALAGAYATAATATAAAAPKPGPGFVALPDSATALAGHRTGAYASARMSVELTLAPRDPAGLDRALRSAYTMGSSGYHRWLAKGQFDARYAPAASARRSGPR